MCGNQTVSTTMMVFRCMKPDATVQQLGIENGGCADPSSGAGSPPAGHQMPDMKICLCDTDLCNTASKKASPTTTATTTNTGSKKSLRNLPWLLLPLEHCYLIFSFD